MGIILDLMLFAILIISVIIGYKRGLINVAFSLCAFILSLAITFFLYTPITNFIITNTDFDEKIENVIIENNLISENNENLKVIENYISDSIDSNTDISISETLAITIAEKAIGIITAIVLFIVIRIILIFAKSFINGITNLPFIKQFDQLGGILYGVLIGFVIIYVILTILFFVVSVNDTGTISDAIDSSYIAKILYNNNIILKLFF